MKPEKTRSPSAILMSEGLRERYDFPIFLNADHCHSLESVKIAVDAGFDSIIFDGANLPFEENIAKTKEAVDYAESTHPEILVEGELGYIGTSSSLLESLPRTKHSESKTLLFPAPFGPITSVKLSGNSSSVLLANDLNPCITSLFI